MPSVFWPFQVKLVVPAGCVPRLMVSTTVPLELETLIVVAEFAVGTTTDPVSPLVVSTTAEPVATVTVCPTKEVACKAWDDWYVEEIVLTEVSRFCIASRLLN